MDELYYWARQNVVNQYQKIPKFPTEIAGVPLVAYGFIAITTITLAGVTLYETDPDASSSSSSSASSSTPSMFSSSPSPSPSTNTIGGNRHKSHRKHQSSNAKKTCRKSDKRK